MIYKINQEIKEQILVLNSNGSAVTGLVNANFTKSLLKSGASAPETLTVTEKDSGFYYVTFTPLASAYYEWKITHATYEPIGWYEYYTVVTYDSDSLYSQADTNVITINTNTDTEISAIDTKLDSNQTVLLGSFAELDLDLKKVLGLTQENFYLDNTSYDGNSNLTNGRIRIYNGSEYVGTGSEIVATYNIESAYSGGLLSTYKVTKQ